MKKFKLTLSIEPEFKIHDCEKLKSIVCDNKTGWCDVFNEYENVENFINSHAAMAFIAHRSFRKAENEDKGHYYMHIEGLGEFKQDRGTLWWKLNNEDTINEMGMIEFFFDNDFDLDVEWSAQEVGVSE